jgi:Prp8 binding protein
MERDAIVFGVAVDPSERCVACVDAGAKVTLFTVQAFSEREDRVIAECGNGVANEEIVPPRIAFGAQGKRMVSGSTDGKARVWEVENLRQPVIQWELGGHDGSVTGVDFHPDHPIVVSSSTDGGVIVREIGRSGF